MRLIEHFFFGESDINRERGESRETPEKKGGGATRDVERIERKMAKKR